MQIDDKKWKETEIGKALILFPGELGEILEHANPQQIVRAQENLGLILWRWYFLRNPNGTSPYFFLEWRKDMEKWPSFGLFSPEVKIAIPLQGKTGQPSLKIDITADFIGFPEQPFLMDLINTVKKATLKYDLGKKYAADLKNIATTFPDVTIDKTFVENNSVDIIGRYLLYSLLLWRESNQLFRNVFSQNGWFSFWLNIIQKSGESGEEGLGCDDLIDSFILRVREKIPDYSVLTKDMEQKKGSIPDKHLLEWYDFWLDFVYLFLIPFSWYLPLIAPFYGDRENFISDIKEVLNNYSEEPLSLCSPPSSVFLTCFGKYFLDNFEMAEDLWL